MSENKKVSLEQLIKKKLEKDGKKNATKEIYVEALNGSITVTNPSDSQRIEFADKTKSGSYVDMMEAYEKLIYDCCPMLHSQELQKEIEVDEIADIGVKVLNFFESDEEDSDEKLKNS